MVTNGLKTASLDEISFDKLVQLGDILSKSPTNQNWFSLAKVFPDKPYDSNEGKRALESFAKESYRIGPRGTPGSPGIALLLDLQRKKKTKEQLISALKEINCYEALVHLVPKTKPTILLHPTSRPFGVGDDINLSCEGDGFPSVQYQWFFVESGGKNPTPLQGQMWSNLHIEKAAREHDGKYCCRVKNEMGHEFSHYAHVQVIEKDDEIDDMDDEEPPVIVTHPQSFEVAEGSSLQLTCFARGSEPLEYKWFKVSEELSNENGSYLQLNDIRPSKPGIPGKTGKYTCRVQNRFGSELSRVATVKVGSIPQITKFPEKVVKLREGDSLVLECKAVGHPSPRYQWYKDGSKCTYEDKERLVRQNVNSGTSGRYYCKVFNSHGSVTTESSHFAEVIVTDNPVRITEHPRSQPADIGSEVSLRCIAAGTERQVSYQWLKEGVPLEDEQNPVLTVKVGASSYGEYTCRTTSSGESQISKAALIHAYPVITPDTFKAVLHSSTLFTLSCSMSGFPHGKIKISGYQWYRNGQPISGETQHRLTIQNVSRQELGSYQCSVITEQYSSLVSKPAIVTELSHPRVITKDYGRAVSLGEPVRLECEAQGDNLTYQWERVQIDGGRFSGYSLRGEMNPQLIIQNCQRDDIGSYRCVVSNKAGVEISGSFTVTEKGSLPRSDLQDYKAVNRDYSDTGKLKKSKKSVADEDPVRSTPTCGSLVSKGPSSLTSLKLAQLPKVLPPEIRLHPVPKQEVHQGEMVQFSCNASGTPRLTFQWHHRAAGGATPLKIKQARDKVLTIWPVLKNNDSGYYHCEVSNGAGTMSTEEAELIVKVSERPVVVKSPKSVEIDEQRTLRLECNVIGEAPFYFEWRRNGMTVSEGLSESDWIHDNKYLGRSSFLEISATTLNDEGKYQCFVRNRRGSDQSKEVQVKIHRRNDSF
eukprot:m.277496 g.277496  ORF g.277496 m.277496 type:complete len:928 (+) comp40608_c0_seq46:88-2871(+)